MRKRFNTYLDSTITWRSYWKFAGICSLIGLLIGGIELLIFCKPWEDRSIDKDDED